jgi:hypothetical protein
LGWMDGIRFNVTGRMGDGELVLVLVLVPSGPCAPVEVPSTANGYR